MLTALPAASSPSVRWPGDEFAPDRSGPLVIPLIGVSTYVADARWGTWERRAAVLPESYFELVAAAGGRPLLLPPPPPLPGGPGAGADEVIDVLDGLVLTGGGDVDPAPTARSPSPRWAASTRTATPASARCWPPRCGPTCRCSPSAGAARCSTWSSAAPCTSTCPTWWATSAHRSAPVRLRRRRGGDGARDPGRRRLRGHAHGALLAPPVHPRPRPRPGGHRLARRRRHRGGRAAVGPLRPRRAVAPRGGDGPAALRRAGRTARPSGATDRRTPVGDAGSA